MSGIDKRLDDLHKRRISALAEYGLLEIEREYWKTRAEKASRDIATICDPNATGIVKGQISICYETSDEASRTLDELEEKAKSKGASGTSAQGVSAV